MVGISLLNKGNLVCANNRVFAGCNSVQQLANVSDIPAQYVHPTTKQCNYSIDTSNFITNDSVGIRSSALLNTITVTSATFNINPYLKGWANVVLQPVSGYVVQTTYSDYTYRPAIITDELDSTYCLGPSVSGNGGNLNIYFEPNGISLNSMSILHSFDIGLNNYYIYNWTIIQGNYINPSKLMFGTYRSGSGNRVQLATSCNVVLNIYGITL